MNSLSTRALSLATVLLGSLIFVPSSLGQVPPFEVTEIMYNPRAGEPEWEWIEIRNTGVVDVDLDGYHVEGLGDPAEPTFTPNIVSDLGGGVTQNTMVPGGGLAILFSNDLGNDDTRFRAAWPNIPVSVPVIAVDFFPELTNSPGPETIGFWSSTASFAMDIGPDPDTSDNEIAQFTNAAVTVTYDDASPWPSDDGNASIQWNGGGSDPTDGANWSLSVVGVNSAEMSTQSSTSGTLLNDSADFANPGVVPAGTASSGILFTEVMYDSAVSNDVPWEWVEILNNTGAELDLTDYVFDDNDGTDLAEANIDSGTVTDGGVAILYNADQLTEQNMIDAWGNLNFIAVTDFPALANGGDDIGLWADFALDYQTEPDPEGSPTRAIANAAASLAYTDDAPFEDSDNAGSIYLTDLDGTNANGLAADGNLWVLSGGDNDPAAEGFSFNASEAFGSMPDNTGMDVGSPGFFTDVASTLVGDYNGNGMIDAGDYTVWRDAFGDGTNPAPLAFGDGTPGSTTVGDYTAWRDAFLANNGLASLATTTPEPTAAVLVALGLLLAPAARRR